MRNGRDAIAACRHRTGVRSGLGWLALLACVGVQAAGADDASTAVAQTTLGILGFARWPQAGPELRLCVIGVPRHADALLDNAMPPPAGGRRLVVRQRAAVDAAADCDALYIGALPEAERRDVARRIAGHAVLTIDETPDACAGAGMFCLDIQPEAVGFEVNLDGLARSGVRVHPGVLQLGRQLGKAP